jgi:hypothetical protein
MQDNQPLKGEKVSIREFARRMGVRDTSVHKAIKSGKIINGLHVGDDGSKAIIFEIAKSEWAFNRDPSYAARSEVLGQTLGVPVAPVPPAPPAPPAPAPQQDADTSLAAAKRAQAVLKVQQMKMDLERSRGALVDKQQVYTALFEAGTLVRTSVLAVPDRVIDDIMAQKTRGAAFQILYDALVEALSSVADATKKPI